MSLLLSNSIILKFYLTTLIRRMKALRTPETFVGGCGRKALRLSNEAALPVMY